MIYCGVQTTFIIILACVSCQGNFDADIAGGYPSDCRMTRGGHEYGGTLATTRGGFTCQSWTSQTPNSHSYRDKHDHYPELNSTRASNYCRNPDVSYSGGPWCYVADRDGPRWQLCDVPLCDRECKLREDGFDYEGELSETVSGHTCATWQHLNQPYSVEHFVDDYMSDTANYCRNPNSSRPDGPWCYVTAANASWEYCSVPTCNITLVRFDITTVEFSTMTNPETSLIDNPSTEASINDDVKSTPDSSQGRRTAETTTQTTTQTTAQTTTQTVQSTGTISQTSHGYNISMSQTSVSIANLTTTKYAQSGNVPEPTNTHVTRNTTVPPPSTSQSAAASHSASTTTPDLSRGSTNLVSSGSITLKNNITPSDMSPNRSSHYQTEPTMSARRTTLQSGSTSPTTQNKQEANIPPWPTTLYKPSTPDVGLYQPDNPGSDKNEAGDVLLLPGCSECPSRLTMILISCTCILSVIMCAAMLLILCMKLKQRSRVADVHNRNNYGTESIILRQCPPKGVLPPIVSGINGNRI